MKKWFKVAAALATFGSPSADVAAPTTSGCWQPLMPAVTCLPPITPSHLDSVARTVVSYNPEISTGSDAIDPRDFGATIGVSDSSAAVQAAVNSLCSKGGGFLRFSAGEYIVHDVNVGCSSVIIAGVAPGLSKTGTVINYSSATDHAFQFRNPAFPHITQSGWLYGDGVENLTFYSNGGSTRALEFDGFYGCFVRNVFLTGSVYDGVKLYGGYKCDIEEVSTSGYVRGILTDAAVKIQGDLAGQNGTGGSCTRASCSTRVDLVSLRNLDAYGTTGSGVFISGFVDTTIGEHITINGMQQGLTTLCAVGLPNVAFCPAFMTFTDFETEGASNTQVNITDSSDFQCYGCYTSGNAAAVGNGVHDYLVNYRPYNTFGQGFRWIGGRISGTQYACVAIGVSDTHISDAYINWCNNSGKNYPGTLYTAGSQHFESNNQYCMINGTVPSQMPGTQVTAPASKAQFTSNTYWGCATGLTTSGSPPDVASVNLQGP
jgi:hypothetical protein